MAVAQKSGSTEKEKPAGSTIPRISTEEVSGVLRDSGRLYTPTTDSRQVPGWLEVLRGGRLPMS